MNVSVDDWMLTETAFILFIYFSLRYRKPSCTPTGIGYRDPDFRVVVTIVRFITSNEIIKLMFSLDLKMI